jgi:hypothetical protein
MKPLRAKIDGNGKSSVVANGASAYAVTRFKDDDPGAAPDQCLGRAQTSGAGAHYHDVEISG